MSHDTEPKDDWPGAESGVNHAAGPGDPRDEAVELDLTLSMGRPPGAARALPTPSEEIGGYRLVRLLGEGGMGVVYEAEQVSPHRRVDLKVMRRSHLVDDIHIRLFHREAEALHREVYEARRLRFGDRHPAPLDSLCAIAGVAALRGERRPALDTLDSAVARGYADGDALAADPDFESLRDDPAFTEIVERARNNAPADSP